MVDAADPVARLLAGLDDLAGSPGEQGGGVAGRRSDLADGCLRRLFEAAAAPRDLALLAVGGYGRRELAPHSDIDLLLLHRGRGEDELRGLAERLLYPLWDSGLDVGHAVRTVEDCLGVADERFDAGLAMLDARLLVGDATLAEDLASAMRAWARRDPRAFAERLLGAAREREERVGWATFMLEPDLKQGVGGLRDVHSLRWLARALPETPGAPLEMLRTSGLLRAGEGEVIEAGDAFLMRVRGALHLVAGRRLDRVQRDLQPQLARDLGFADEPSLTRADALMRAIFEHARQIEHVSGLVFERFLREGVPDREPIPDPSPVGVVQVFADVAEGRLALTPSLLDRVERVVLPPEIGWSGASREAFLRILRAGERGARALEAMDRLGLLVRFLPEWAPVRCRPQRDPYHRYTVDVHLVRTLVRMAQLLDGDEVDDSVALEALGAVRDRDAMLLGALLHDIGKTGEGRHVPLGARVAEILLERIGVPEETRALASFIVTHHLLLSDTAIRRDLADDDLILEVAAKVGDQERLAALYLTLVSDAEATGPAAWTPWRQALVRELVAKVQHVLERGEMGEELAERLAARAEEIRGLLAREDPAAVDRFLLRMPRRYVLGVPPDRAAADFALLASDVGDREVRTSEAPGRRPGTYEVTVVAGDRPGLLSWIAGAFTVAGLSILTAQVFTTSEGVAVDLFEVEGAFEPEVGEERWDDFRVALRGAVGGDPEGLERRVERKRRHYPRPPTDLPVEVVLDDEASDFFTVVEVGAPDRIGLLHDVTRTLADLQLDVHLAKVATYGERVVDAFYVRDMLGRKIDDPDRAAEIERALVERLSA